MANYKCKKCEANDTDNETKSNIISITCNECGHIHHAEDCSGYEV